MKLKHYIVFALFIGLFTTCKKFPEDHFITLRTVKGRLNGKWKFENILYMGQEIKSLYNDSLQPHSIDDVILDFKFDYETTLKKSSSYYEKYNLVGIDDPSYHSVFATSLKFEIHSKNIKFNNDGNGLTYGKFNKIFLEEPNFQIRTLYKNHFKIKNSLYEVTLSKIKQ